MKEILALIEKKQLIYSQLPFFQFLRDRSISPEQRLAFAPCAAPFIMSFADLNKYVLRQEPTQDEIQVILNKHSYEDDFHWQWFLEDLQQLGYNHSLRFNQSLEFLWSKETKTSRLLSYQLYQHIVDAEPFEKLVALEAIEATSDVLVLETQKATSELKSITNLEYKYFGDCHLEAESNHEAHSDSTHNFVEEIYISEKILNRSNFLVNDIFDLFTQWTEELLDFAVDNRISQTLNNGTKQKQMV